MKTLESYDKWNSIALELFEKMKTTEQSAIHHAEGNVYTHTQMVVSEVEKLFSTDYSAGRSASQKKIMLQTALLHDIAKPLTTVFEDGDWRSPGHAKLGEAVAREILWDNYDFETRETISALVRYHGLPIWFDDKEMIDQAVIAASLRCNLNMLANFAECDFKGRICKDLDNALFLIELFREKADELNCLNIPYQFDTDWQRLSFFKRGTYQGAPIWEPDGAECVVLCGLPGSGKSTWAKNNWDGDVVEMDAIRERLKIKPGKLKAQGLIHQTAKEDLRESLRKKRPVLWNATNLTAQQRSVVIDIALEYKAKTKIIYFDCELQEVLKRNKKREKEVPQKVIERMFRKFELPTLVESHKVEIIK